ncbi:Mov34/MPN/PAD-1 family protein [Labedaea rhizosphaerae]|uniref:JAB domain-containing protein similar to deubiquitination enzymes n=1 Tax=Labedaea rhizosphaerae TaxID=598644 RepID=A0A4R6SEJ9_LABRH|nr:Mov34/MPN/PAD-1 family protein [Labedaea rhizosphaerae]TDP98157.1 JAB domain-containing protein similar to deubiquitination enzymes [Labedaea rhizosphaerae]
MNNELTVTFAANVATTVKAITTAALPRETGGLLVGWWDLGTVFIKDAVEVVDPEATSVGWSRHQETAQRILDQTLEQIAHPWLGYVGDWHSHPKPCPPSDTDLRTLAQSSLQFTNPLILLVHAPPDTFEVRAAHTGQSCSPYVQYRTLQIMAD